MKWELVWYGSEVLELRGIVGLLRNSWFLRLKRDHDILWGAQGEECVREPGSKKTLQGVQGNVKSPETLNSKSSSWSQNMGVSQNRETPKYYNPYFLGTPKKGIPSFGKPPYWSAGVSEALARV